MLEFFNIQSVNSYNNPLQYDGQLIHGNNIQFFPYGAISKRGGYYSILDNPDGAQVNALFAFPFQNGTQLFTYRASGSNLYFSTQGTTNWQQASPGTIANGAYVSSAVFNNILAVGDGNTQLWTSTDGTSFSQPASAPIAQYMTIFHNRLYTADGTSSNVQYSTANDPTNWTNVGTADSSFLVTTSPGANQGLFVAGNMLQMTKSKGDMFTWDDTDLTDVSTVYGPTSPRSLAQIDNYWFYVNVLGIFGDDGVNKEVLSNPVQRMFYNRLGVNVSGVNLVNSGNVLGATFLWDYLAVVGNINDDFTGVKLNNAIIKYDYQKNSFCYWTFADFPTAITSYFDIDNHPNLVFGNASGQVFQYDPGRTSDNGNPIDTEAIFLFTYAAQSTGFSQTSASMQLGSSYRKYWKWLRLFFNPGCEMNIQFSFSDSLSPQHQIWSEVINMKTNAKGNYWQEADGSLEIRFPRNNGNNEPYSRFLFLKIYESSTTSQWSYYGSQIEADPDIVK